MYTYTLDMYVSSSDAQCSKGIIDLVTFDNLQASIFGSTIGFVAGVKGLV